MPCSRMEAENRDLDFGLLALLLLLCDEATSYLNHWRHVLVCVSRGTALAWLEAHPLSALLCLTNSRVLQTFHFGPGILFPCQISLYITRSMCL